MLPAHRRRATGMPQVPQVRVIRCVAICTALIALNFGVKEGGQAGTMARHNTQNTKILQ